MKKTTFRTAFMVLILLQLLLIFYYGTQKAGFHEDEYFSYFSPNRSVGFYYVDREWVRTDTLMREFAVVPGEGFRFDQVRIFTSWDTHPPLFYDLIHLACSLTPWLFTKWQGIAVNMVGFVLVQLLLAALCKQLSCSKSGEQRARALALLCCASYGFLPGAVTGVILIRMYEYLTAAFLLSLLFHVRIIRSHERRSFLTALTGAALATFLGFLTQYFYILLLAPAGVFTALFLLLRHRREGIRKGLREAFAYGFSQALALGLTVLYYPWSMAHIFGGYRGDDVASDFFDISNTLDRLALFGRLLTRFGFAGLLPLMLLPVVLFVLCLMRKTAKNKTAVGSASADHATEDCAGTDVDIAGYLLCLFSSLGYFFLVSKVGLILGFPSFRYVLPLVPLCVLFSLLAVRGLLDLLPAGGSPSRSALLRRCAFLAAAAVFTLSCIKGIAEKDVLFLYREDVEKVAFAREHKDLPVVIIYNNSTPYNIWRLTNELFEHDALYYMNPDNLSPLEDETILASDDLLVYVADSHTADDMLRLVAESGTKAPRRITHVFQEDMWNLYELSRPAP
ncbi:MAG: hypothetical protein J6I56_05690 [Lachnospiraceae bacterium]|nr:hypothetical protein [Lachnospiraceae bacterium]